MLKKIKKCFTHGETRTRNLRFRRPTPYPLGHAGCDVSLEISNLAANLVDSQKYAHMNKNCLNRPSQCCLFHFTKRCVSRFM